MLQARQLGKALFVGVHSDEDILHNKGPVVMTLEERIVAVDACKWSTTVVPNAPYVTDPAVMEEYGCKYVVHGDDITTDANGEDCYQEVKDLGKFVVVKRTPNISTTDLVGRMLLMNKGHHFRPILNDQHSILSEESVEKIQAYASDETGLNPHSGVYINIEGQPFKEIVSPSSKVQKLYESIYYIDGGFDLFHPGLIEALKIVKKEAEKTNSAVMVGINDDFAINRAKGLNYPIMNLFERTLCVLQCRYVDGVVLGAPYIPSLEFLDRLPGKVTKVFHGPTPIYNEAYRYIESKGLLANIGEHAFDNINTEFIVNRVLQNKAVYEERQKKKGWKSERELQLEANEKKNYTTGK